MKIVAQSLVPVNPLPYMHLGYIAAAPINAAKTYWALTFFCTVMALYIWKRSRLAGIAFLVLAVASFGWSRVQYQRGEVTLTYKMTKRNANYILGLITQFGMASKGKPVDINQVMSYIHLCSKFDGWKRPYRFKERVETITTHPTRHFTLTSSGPDGIFDTADDIVHEKSIELPLPGKEAR